MKFLSVVADSFSTAKFAFILLEGEQDLCNNAKVQPHQKGINAWKTLYYLLLNLHFCVFLPAN